MPGRDETLADGWRRARAVAEEVVAAVGDDGGGDDGGGSSVRTKSKLHERVNFDPTVCEGRWPLR